jgi:hypothetical protein
MHGYEYAAGTYSIDIDIEATATSPLRRRGCRLVIRFSYLPVPQPPPLYLPCAGVDGATDRPAESRLMHPYTCLLAEATLGIDGRAYRLDGTQQQLSALLPADMHSLSVQGRVCSSFQPPPKVTQNRVAFIALYESCVVSGY